MANTPSSKVASSAEKKCVALNDYVALYSKNLSLKKVRIENKGSVSFGVLEFKTLTIHCCSKGRQVHRFEQRQPELVIGPGQVRQLGLCSHQLLALSFKREAQLDGQVTLRERVSLPANLHPFHLSQR